jgi:hypothetical protein
MNSAHELVRARKIRAKYAFKRLVEPWDAVIEPDLSTTYSVAMNEWGVFEVHVEGSDSQGSERDQRATHKSHFPVPSIAEFILDHKAVEHIVQDKLVKTLCAHRLKTMEHLFDMHFHMKWKKEEFATQVNDIADFFTVAKVTE